MAGSSGKCPKCEKLVTSLKIKTLTATCEDHKYKAVTYNCPYCAVVLGASIDQIALVADTARRVVKELREKA